MPRIAPVLFFVAIIGGLLAAMPAGGVADQADEEKVSKLIVPLKKIEKGDDELRRLLKERYNEAASELQARYKEFIAGRGDLDSLYEANRSLLESGLELTDKPEEKIALLAQRVGQAREIEQVNQGRYDAGRIPVQTLNRCRYLRLDAEIQLLRAKRALAESK
jgi:hypothetical protein